LIGYFCPMQQVKGHDLTLHILGGGQLGKMLIEAASDWNIRCHVLDPDPDCSCSRLAWQFTCGSFKDYDAVMAFCAEAHYITIEIEHVNTDALRDLKAQGKQVFPDPDMLDIIKDKGKQKSFYAEHGIPTSPFTLYDDADAIRQAVASGTRTLPFVQKSCTAGYDGKGVQVVRTKDDLDKLLPGASLAEELIPFEKELAVIVARSTNGDTKAFPAVEMEFHPTANLVEFLLSPAHINSELEQKAQQLAVRTIEAMNLYGVLAVEMFLTADGDILVNEVAPRPHNSGHHTIEANITSQYQQLLRSIFGFPLGSTALTTTSMMVNLLGEDGYTGEAIYEGLPECLAMEGVYVHLYGKKITKPFRKMGHVTIVDSDAAKAREKANFVKDNLKIKA
ncbi:MAG TPA: 5-(carboxyamino)imidazole ribonucleotide synthase, partial [Chitinophagales bacterium]|nr:5-(carboxyamino)imidazole ribonucleotide synthase [Chitinophagales bacterium]